jgi:hypothetical protein
MTWLYLTLILLNLADAWTTAVILTRGTELNPGLNWLMSRIGVIPALAVSKAIILGAVGYVTFGLSVSWWDNALSFLCGWYAMTVVMNVVQVRRMP